MTATKRKLPRNIIDRDGTLYLRKQIHGRLILRSLKTNVVSIAKQRAKVIIEEETAKRFAPPEPKPEIVSKRVSSLNSLTEEYKRIGRLRGLAPRTVSGNLYALGFVIRKGTGDGILAGLSLSVLTKDLVLSFREAMLKEVDRDDAVAEERCRRSINSMLRQGRGVFSKKSISEMKGITFPDTLKDFMDCPGVNETTYKYFYPPKQLVTKTIREAREKLTGAQYLVFLLCYDMALRPAEAMAAKSSWVELDDDGGKFMTIRARPEEGFKPKWNSSRRIPLHDLTYNELKMFADLDRDSYLLGEDEFTRREVMKSFTTWMREIGWDKDRFPKAAYELRKLMGSRWFTTIGIGAACKWLGHKNLSVTSQYYADLSEQPEPLPRGE